jgi:DNA processing protein
MNAHAGSLTVLPQEAYLAALAGFDRMTTKRLSSLLAQLDPPSAFAVATGEKRPPPQIAALLAADPDLAARWRRDGKQRDPAECWQRCIAHDIAVVARTDPWYPAQLLDDPTGPAVLFARGDLAALDARRVGIVGTRNATQRGRETAAQFGFELAAQGVAVVSGLAKGIDGAAHRGALAAAVAQPVAVVGRSSMRHCSPSCATADWCCRNGHPARSPTRSGFPCATGSWPVSSKCWWSSRVASEEEA